MALWQVAISKELERMYIFKQGRQHKIIGAWMDEIGLLGEVRYSANNFYPPE